MTTEQMEAAAEARVAGSGSYTKILRVPHPCVKPNPAEAARVYQVGTEWTCRCGQVFRLTSGNQRDPGYYWSPLTKPVVQGGNAWDR